MSIVKIKKQTKKDNIKSRRITFRRVILMFLIWLLSILIVIFKMIISDLPEIKDLDYMPKKPIFTIRDMHGDILARYGDISIEVSKYNDLPKNLINALIAIEDRRFFSHFGIDILGITRAAYHNFKAGKIAEGGSTITQQLAKMIFLKPSRTFKRKIQEVILALQIERKFTKSQILLLYINKVYMGRGLFGFDSAARFYFGKKISDLSLFEAAILAGILKSPAQYNPYSNFQSSVERGKQVLFNMQYYKLISKQEYNNAKPPRTIIARGINRGIMLNPYFADYALEKSLKMINGLKRSIDIYTTLDIKIQQVLEEIVAQSFTSKIQQEYNVSQLAVVILNNQGSIVAMLGGKNYMDSSFNRAIYAKRQSGSLFKLFVYLAALKMNYNPEDKILDTKITIGNWTPKNIDGIYHGEVSLNMAFAKSLNVATIRLAENIGRKSIIKIAKDLGISSSISNYPSVTLGTDSMNLLELVGAYHTIQSDGIRYSPFAIAKIIDNEYRLLYRHEPESKRILDQDLVTKMKKMMHSVVTEGSGKRAYISNINMIGKTGTTQNYKDAWFIGSFQTSSNSYTIGIWCGNDDNRPMNKMTGSTVPAAIWNKIAYVILNLKNDS